MSGKRDRAPVYLTIDELAERWRISERHIYAIRKSGALTATKLGRALRFHIDDVLAYERRQRGGA
jgi:excisionase family DNA binding protein